MKKWKILLTLAAIVIVSFLAGFEMGRHQTRVEMRQRFDPEHWDAYAMDMLNGRLRLSSTQQVRIQAAIDVAVVEMKVLHRNTASNTTQIVNELLSEIDRELTPEQRTLAESLAPSDEELTIDLLKVKPRVE